MTAPTCPGYDSLADALPAEMARVRDEVLPSYIELRRFPNVICEPQIAWMRGLLDTAAKALAEGDVVAMLRVYTELREIEE